VSASTWVSLGRLSHEVFAGPSDATLEGSVDGSALELGPNTSRREAQASQKHEPGAPLTGPPQSAHSPLVAAGGGGNDDRLAGTTGIGGLAHW